MLALNAKDGGNRRFILCETEDYADTLTAERVRRVIGGYAYTGTAETELLPPQKVTWTTFKKAQELLDRIEGIENLERANFEKIEKKIEDGVLTVVGKRTVRARMPGLGGSFTYAELGEPMDLTRLLAETPGTLPGLASLARYLFYTATGHALPENVTQRVPPVPGAARGKKARASVGADAGALSAGDAPHSRDGLCHIPASTDAPVLIGETAGWRIYLHYRPEEAWLRSPAAAFTRTQAEALAAENKGRGKQVLVFAAAKYISHKALQELSKTAGVRVDFAQLPYALHRVQAE